MTGCVLTTIRAGEVMWDAERGTFGPPTGRLLTDEKEMAHGCRQRNH